MLSYGDYNCSWLGFPLPPGQEKAMNLPWSLPGHCCRKPACMDRFCPQWPWGCQWPITAPQLKAFGHALVLLKSARTMQSIQAGTEFGLTEANRKAETMSPLNCSEIIFHLMGIKQYLQKRPSWFSITLLRGSLLSAACPIKAEKPAFTALLI